jgi:hypothetical protein
VTISAAAAQFLANVGPAEADLMMADISGRQTGRLGAEKARAERMLIDADAKTVHKAVREARVVVNQAFLREKEALASVRFFIRKDGDLENLLLGRLAGLDAVRAAYIKEVEGLYASRCRNVNVKAEMAVPTKDEIRLGGLVPVRTPKVGRDDARRLREELQKLKYQPPVSIMMAERELRNFIDGKRSILDIRDAASAEYEPLDLLDVEKWVGIQEKLGLVTLRKK